MMTDRQNVALATAQQTADRMLRLTPRWTPLKHHPVQQAFFWHPSRIKINPSGRRSGKTELEKRKAVLKLLMRRPWPVKIALAAPSYGQAKDIFWEDLKGLVPDPWKASIRETDLEIKTVWGAMIRVFGFDRPRRIEGVPWDHIGIDEIADCFVAGTLVDTPDGPRAIETLKPGDAVYNANGIGRVIELSVRRKSAIAVVRVSNFGVISSKNHRYLTRRGWVRADQLEKGDELITHAEAVQMVRGDVHPQGSSAGALQQILRSEDSGSQGEEEAASAWSAQGCISGEAYGESLHEDRGGPTAYEPGHEGEGAQTSRARWQRNGHDGSAADAAGCSGRGLHRGACGCHGQAGEGRESDSLQDRHCSSAGASGNRGGWPNARMLQAARCGPEEGRIPHCGRVESVEIHESGSPEFAALSGGKDHVDLFDIAVSGHPSFCVGGFVVHNCPPKCFARNVRPALATLGRKGSCDLIGVPDEVGRNQAEYEQLYELGLDWPNGDRDVCSFHWTSADILDAEEIAAMQRQMDALEFQQELGGLFVRSGGKALPMFDRHVHVDEAAGEFWPELPLDWTMDFGVTPAASLVCQTYRGFVRVLAEIVVESDGSVPAQVEAFQRLLGDRGWAPSKIRVFGDAAGNSSHSNIGVSDYRILEQYMDGLGYNVEYRQLRRNPLVKDSLNALRGRIATADRQVHLMIHPQARRLIEDCRTAPWPDPHQLREYHCLAALRYHAYELFGHMPAIAGVGGISLPTLGSGPMPMPAR